VRVVPANVAAGHERGGAGALEDLLRRATVGAVRHCGGSHLSVSRVVAGLKVSRNTANTPVLAEGRRVLIDDPARFRGVRVLGVDEHVWRHTRLGDKYVTVIIDLTPARDKTGPHAC
jgi:hypothetical protein